MSERWNAESYVAHSASQTKVARELIAAHPFRGDERVLDVGCGPGEITAEIAAKVPAGTVTGLDSSADMIAYAREHFPQVNFVQASAEELDFSDEFDLITSFSTLHWIPDLSPLFARFFKALHRSGQLLARTISGPSTLRSAADTACSLPRWKEKLGSFEPSYRLHSPEEVLDASRKAGFEVERLLYQLQSFTFDDPEDLALWMSQFLQEGELLEPDERLPFARDVVAHCSSQTNHRQHSISLLLRRPA